MKALAPATESARVAFRWPVSKAATIAAPAAVVWQTITRPGSLENCHPLCSRNPVTRWPGADSVDEVHYLNGVVYERRFREWREGSGFDLEIFHKGRSLAWVSWRITPIDDARSSLRIIVYPLALQHLSPAIRFLPHWLYLRPRLASYLHSVVRGYEWFIARNEAVPRNQFGTHRWYSV